MAEYVDSDHPPFQPDEARGLCDCCGFGPVATVQVVVGRPVDDPTMDLCEVCYSTLVGQWARYPDVHSADKTALGKLIAWGINHLKAQAESDAVAGLERQCQSLLGQIAHLALGPDTAQERDEKLLTAITTTAAVQGHLLGAVQGLAGVVGDLLKTVQALKGKR